MTIIDMHAHIAHRGLFHAHFLLGMKAMLRQQAADEYAVQLEESLLDRITQRRLADPDCVELLSQMDNAGIAKTVLLIADFGFGYDETALTLDALYLHYHRVLRAHPERFVVFGGADPRRGSLGLALFERGLRELGFSGLKLYPACGYESDDSRLSAYYEVCDAFHAPVLLHTGPSLPDMQGDRRFPSSIAQIASRFPRVCFILGHAAFQNFEVTLELAKTHPNVYLETSGFQKLLNEPDLLRCRLRELFDQVPDQVVFGSDWPVFSIGGTQLQWVEYFKGMGVLSEPEQLKLFTENAQRCLADSTVERIGGELSP